MSGEGRKTNKHLKDITDEATRLLEYMRLNGTIDPMPPSTKVGRPLWDGAQEHLQQKLNQISRDIREIHQLFGEYCRSARGPDHCLGRLESVDDLLSTMLEQIDRLMGDCELSASLVLEVHLAHREWIEALQEPCGHAYDCVNELLFCATIEKAGIQNNADIDRIRESMRGMSAYKRREEMWKMRESPHSAASLLMPTLPVRQTQRFDINTFRLADAEEDCIFAQNIMRSMHQLNAM